MGRLRMDRDSLPYLENSEITFTKPNELKNKWKEEIFNNDKPLWIEIGMGKGEFTLLKSSAHPEVNFIGIEKYPTVQQIPVKKAEELNIPNLKFISGDANEILEWFEEGSVDKIFINFPDPWPKDRHAKRRLVFNTFLNNYYKLLAKGGVIEFKTDQIDLFEFSLEQAKEHTKFTIENETRNLHALPIEENPSPIKTGYEKKFSALGNEINYVEFHKK